MVPPLCLLTLLGERFAFLFGLWGLLARNAGRPPLSLRDISPAQRGNLPTPRRKLLKKLEQNFYVFYVFSDTLCGNKKAMPSAWCSSVSPAGCRVIRRANSKYFRCHPAHSQLAVSLLAALVPIGSSFFRHGCAGFCEFYFNVSISLLWGTLTPPAAFCSHLLSSITF